MKKSIFGLSENIVAALSYVFTFFSGIVVLILERENKFVRFHALQSTIWFIFLSVLGWVLRMLRHIPLISLLASPVAWAIGVISFFSLIWLALSALKGRTFKLPIIGDVVWAQINK